MAVGRIGRSTCETTQWLDIRLWQRAGRLRTDETFTVSLTQGGQPCGGVDVRVGSSTVVLTFKFSPSTVLGRKLLSSKYRSSVHDAILAAPARGFTALNAIGGQRNFFLWVMPALDVAAVVIFIALLNLRQ
jgi:hypothetical protein